MIALVLDSKIQPARVVRHSIAARRLRLEIPGLVGDRHLARRAERAAGGIPGILEARADPLSGRMLLRYAPGTPLLEELRAEPMPSSEGAAPVGRPHQGGRARAGLGAEVEGGALPWHGMKAAEVLETLGSGEGGLRPDEAAARLRRYGLNLVEAVDVRSKGEIVWEQVANLPMALLLGSATFAALSGSGVEATAIFVVVGMNAAIGYRIERKNQELLQSWRKLEAGVADVVRGGTTARLPAAQLVPGDLILCAAGDVLPADARLLEGSRLSCDEAALTGESEPREKGGEPVEQGALLAERTSMLYAGTVVAGGFGRAVVVATGASTEVAKVRKLVESERAPVAPLTRRMERLGDGLAKISVAAAGLAAAGSLVRGRGLARAINDSIALGVAAVPEALPLITTAALFRSMQRLAADGLIVRRLAAAETLGTVTVICADKTGTLTKNEMKLEAVDLGERESGLDGAPRDPAKLRAHPDRIFEDQVSTIFAAAVLNSDIAFVQEGGEKGGQEERLVGSSTERALVLAAKRAGLDPHELFERFPRIELRERSSGSLYVVSVHRDGAGEGGVAFIKGAPGQVLGLCDAGPEGPWGERERERLYVRNAALASEGLRVLALGWRRLDRWDQGFSSGGFTFLGFLALRDPPREGAGDAISRARSAGIRTLILTGDQPRTAKAIAAELGLSGGAILANELAELSSAELKRRLEEVAVLARVTPEEKLRVIKLLQARGEIVAMAGDGINDAPALKAADVGVSVGGSASDLARQVSDLVMSGDDLRTILVAVGEGRIVQDNLKRSVRFLTATNLSEIALVLGASLAGATPPLSALQLLWINLLTDTLPALALAWEPGDPEVLDRPPALPGAPFLGAGERGAVIRDGLFMAGIGAAGMLAGGAGLAFSTLPAAQIAYAAICRAPRHRGHGGPGTDLRFGALVGGTAALHLAGLMTPPLRRILGITASPATLAGGFAVGLALPWVLRGLPETQVVRRRGPAALDRKIEPYSLEGGELR